MGAGVASGSAGFPKEKPTDLVALSVADVPKLGAAAAGAPKEKPDAEILDVVPKEKPDAVELAAGAPNENPPPVALAPAGAPNLKFDADVAAVPNEKAPALVDAAATPASTLSTAAAVGFGVSQARHLVLSAVFEIIHVGQSQLPAGFVGKFFNCFSGLNSFMTGAAGAVAVGAAAGLGFGDSQAAHFEKVGGFCTIQVRQSQVPSGLACLNLLNGLMVAVAFVMGAVSALGLLSVSAFAFGLAVSHAAHLAVAGLLVIMHVGQSQEPAALAGRFNRFFNGLNTVVAVTTAAAAGGADAVLGFAV